MANLYEKLKRFSNNNSNGKVVSQTNPPSSSAHPDMDKLINIPGVFQGSQLLHSIEQKDDEKKAFLNSIGMIEISNEFGSFGLRETFYPEKQIDQDISYITGSLMARQAKDETFNRLDLHDLLFVDTETTGLAGGAGTVPFLIGIGFFDKGGFRVQQYFMRDYNEEPAVLHAVRERAQQYKAVVSYNGKCFDLPLLQTRYLLNRLHSDIAVYPHLDLLYTARRLWSEMLPDCRLATVESRILHRGRAEDIPGALIPYVFFDFLRGIRIHRMRPVLSHNADDIFSLALLLAKTCRMIAAPLDDWKHGLELVGTGKFLASEGDYGNACNCFETAILHDNLPEEIKPKIYKNLSLFYKKQQRFDKAAELWRKMIDEYDDLFGYLELVKYLEHKTKKVDEALHLTERLLQRLPYQSQNQNNGNFNLAKMKAAILHRRNRLLRKISF